MFFPGPQPHEINNDDFAGKDQNENKKVGMRALLKVDLNDNWSVTPGLMVQNAENEGYWEHNPEFFGDLETGRLWPAAGIDDWYQASLTLDGRIGNVDMVYAGAYLDRSQDYQYDYSDYTQWWAYYLTNPDYYDPPGYCVYYNDAGDCAIGTQYVDATNNFTRQSHELRFQSSADQRFRWVGGLFYQKQKHDYALEYTVPDVDVARSVVEGGHVVWLTKQVREDRDQAIFGELSYDFTEKFTGTVGARYFEYDNTLYGFNGFLRHCTGQYIDGEFVEIPAAEGGEIQYPCFDTKVIDGRAKGDDWAFKGNLEYRIDEDKLVYATYSEGFRAGGTNRAKPEDIVGLDTYSPDFITNYEIGWKTTLADGAVRFNGAIYLIDWDNFQFGFLDFDISNLTIVTNSEGDSRTTGVEWELNWAMNDSNTLSFSGSYNDAELQGDFWRIPGDEEAGEPPNALKGAAMPYVPKLQLTGIWRADFNYGTLPGFFQAAASYTGSRWNSLDTLNVEGRRKMDDYTLVNLSTGIEKDNWTLGFFISNLFDERAEINIADPGFGAPPGNSWTTTTNRPRSYALRFTQRF